MNRGARRQAIFYDDDDRTLFLRILAVADELHAIDLHAYCLMGNHYHLLVHTPLGELAPFMKFLGQTYTQRFNRRHGYDGALFRGRYHSELIEDDQHLLATVRYIHRNPCAAAICGTPDEYAWSSMASYTNANRNPGWLKTGTILDLFGGVEPFARSMRLPDDAAA
ncbi:MAG: transposase [Actinomycetota bacterium]